MITQYTLSPLSCAYLAAILAAQAREDELTTGHPCHVHVEAQQPLDEAAILSLATERGLAEILHLTTMPRSRSTRIPFGSDTGLGLGVDDALDPGAGPRRALQAVRQAIPFGPRRATPPLGV